MFSSLKELKYLLGQRTWRLFYICLFLGICWFAVETLFVLVMQGFLRSLGLTQGLKTQLPDFYPTSLFYSMLVMILFGLCRSIVLYFKTFYNGISSQSFIAFHRKNVFEYALKKASLVNSSNILTIYNDVILKSGNVIHCSATFIISVTSAILFLSYGLYIAPYELLIGLGFIVLFNLPLRYLNNKVKQYGSELQVKTKDTNQILSNGIRNHFLLRIYNFIEPEINKAFSKIDEYDATHRKYYAIYSFKTSYPLFIGALVISIVSYISLNYIHTNGVVLLSFLYIFLRFVQSVSDSTAALVHLRLNHQAFSDLKEIQTKLEEIRIEEQPFDKSISHSENKALSIEIKNISFGFAGKDQIINNFSASIKSNEIFLIKGESGSGKSTLISLILGILKPHSGDISINGMQVDHTVSKIYNLVGYVGPDPFLIPGTLRENLLLGHPDPSSVTEESMKYYLDILRLNNVASDSQKFDLYLNESAQLSTGQKQRISFARALLREPKLLVLDEATSNLDHETERVIIENISKNRKDMTVLVISHKNSFDGVADQVFVKGEHW